MRFVVYKIIKLKISPSLWDKWCQFVKFGIVGLSNNFMYYITYVVLILLSVHYLIANFFGFLVSVINAYYWNNKYVFGIKKEQRDWWKVFIKTFVSYAGTGLILNNLLLLFWVNVIGIHEAVSPLFNLVITIPLNFIVNKYWTFHD